jgi:hypothetical protein
MADTRINALTTSTVSVTDDFLPIDGATAGTKKLSAFSPSFGGAVTVGQTLTVNGAGTSSFAGNVQIPNATNYVVRNAANTSTAMRMYADSSNYGYVDATANTELRLQVGAGTKLSIGSTGIVTIPATTASTTTSSGALVVGNGTSGGLGVGGNVSSLGFLLAGNGASKHANTDATFYSTATGNTTLHVAGFSGGSQSADILKVSLNGISEWLAVKASGQVACYASTSSNNTSSGALVVSGGVGVAKSLNVGEAVTVAGGAFAAASFYKSASLGTVLSGATGSSYDLYITNPAGNHVMQVPTGTRNVEFAATLTTVGAITSGASISTSAPTGGSGAWELGVYSTTAPSATGYVTIEIGGVAYKLLASNV